MRRNVLLEVFLKDILAGEIILPGEIIKRFPGDRTFVFAGLVEWARAPQIEPQRRTPRERDREDPHQCTSGKAPRIL